MKQPWCLGIFLVFLKSAFGQVSYPDNIYPDTAYAPFYYGVASGDPMLDRVLIWTAVFVTDTNQLSVPLKWQVSSDKNFSQLVAKGETLCLKSHDYTTQVDASPLRPGYKYYYRFITADGKFSQTGRCQTLPPDTVTHVKLALVSCSSVWAGYFNAYRRMAERDDIDFIMHVGDYVYDFVDDKEKKRIPQPFPTVPKTLDEWHARHKYYLLDPDLRAARQNKTWIAEWDNHDSRRLNADGKVTNAIAAFHDYIPIRTPDSTHPERIYRSFHFGKLADLFMIDMYLFRGQELYAPGKKTILGNKQNEWFKNALLTSKAEWKLIGNQEMMGSWLSEGVPRFLHVPGNGKFFDPEGWDGHIDDRNRLYRFLDSNGINNFVAMTGDMHMSYVIDLTPEPKNKEVYNPHTGKGAVGVEVLGPSLSRPAMGEIIPKAFIPLVQRLSRRLNPHHVWCKFSKHGYVTVDVNPERCVAEFWYSDVLKKTDKETFGRGYTVLNGVNHWERKGNKSQKKSTHPAG